MRSPSSRQQYGATGLYTANFVQQIRKVQNFPDFLIRICMSCYELSHIKCASIVKYKQLRRANGSARPWQSILDCLQASTRLRCKSDSEHRTSVRLGKVSLPSISPPSTQYLLAKWPLQTHLRPIPFSTEPS